MYSFEKNAGARYIACSFVILEQAATGFFASLKNDIVAAQRRISNTHSKTIKPNYVGADLFVRPFLKKTNFFSSI